MSLVECCTINLQILNSELKQELKQEFERDILQQKKDHQHHQTIIDLLSTNVTALQRSQQIIEANLGAIVVKLDTMEANQHSILQLINENQRNILVSICL